MWIFFLIDRLCNCAKWDFLILLSLIVVCFEVDYFLDCSIIDVRPAIRIPRPPAYSIRVAVTSLTYSPTFVPCEEPPKNQNHNVQKIISIASFQGCKVYTVNHHYHSSCKILYVWPCICMSVILCTEWLLGVLQHVVQGRQPNEVGARLVITISKIQV